MPSPGVHPAHDLSLRHLLDKFVHLGLARIRGDVSSI
jgi:hypothetical protein